MGIGDFDDSNAAWFGDLPQGWKCRRIKTLFSMREERSFLPLEEVNLISLYSSVGVRQNADIEYTSGNKAKNADGYKIVRKGDIVVNILLCWMGAVGYSAYDGVTSPAYDIYIPNHEANSKYYHYLFRTPMFSQQCYKAGRGIMAMRLRTYSPQFRSITVPCPPLAEQERIVRFLDWKVSAINRLIAIRKRQIDGLEELKRSCIEHLVMGRTETIPQRETAVSWVKTIPSHWSEKTLVRFAGEQQIKNTGMLENNLLSLSYGKIVNKDIHTTDGLLPASFEGYQIVHDGNIILRLTDLQNDHKSLRTGLVTQTGMITSAYVCLKVREGMIPEYLQLQLHVADLCKAFYGMGGGVRQGIGFQDIRRLIIAVPPLDEQRRILERVHDIEKLVNRAIRTRKKNIAALEDLKKRLIADTVTGKMDVRDVAIPAYEFAQEEADADAEEQKEEFDV